MSADRFDLRGKVAVVTGGYGVLGGSLADALAGAGAKVAILGRNREAAERKVESLRSAGGEAMALVASALDEGELRRARETLVAAWGGVDILVNAAGGNVARARTDNAPPFAMPLDAFDEVLRLNLHGTVYPTLVFGEAMAERKKGSVVNISSMAAQRPLKGIGRLLGGQGGRRQLHALAGRRARAPLRPRPARERDRARLLRHDAEPRRASSSRTARRPSAAARSWRARRWGASAHPRSCRARSCGCAATRRRS